MYIHFRSDVSISPYLSKYSYMYLCSIDYLFVFCIYTELWRLVSLVLYCCPCTVSISQVLGNVAFLSL